MYCRQCGTNNADGAKFCEKCGAKMIVPKVAPQSTKNKKKGKKGLLIIILAAVLVLAVVLAVFFSMQKKKEKEYEAEIDKAERYIEELNYDKAEATYLAAIEISPKEEEPYIRLAEIYTVQNEPEKAIEILEQGLKETKSEVIEQKYELYTYVGEVLIPEIGEAEIGTYETEYEMVNEYAASTAHITELSGVIASRIMDFDDDGEDELLVAILKNDMPDENDPDKQYNAIYLEMYEVVDGEIEKTAEFLACDGVMGGRDYESSGVFLKNYEDTIYICGGNYGHVNMFADGSFFTSFVMTYEEEEFRIYTGQIELFGGSSFEDLWEEKEEMAEKLDAIDLPKAAEKIRETSMTQMTYEDEGIDLLFRIEGESVGGSYARYNRTQSLSALGKYVIRFWIGNEEPSYEAEEGSILPEKMSEEELASLREELDALMATTEANIDAAQSGSMMELKSAVGEGITAWEEEMEYVLEIVYSYLTDEEAEAIRIEQEDWLAARERAAEEAAAPYTGGTLYGLEYGGVKYDETIARCYELLEILE